MKGDRSPSSMSRKSTKLVHQCPLGQPRNTAQVMPSAGRHTPRPNAPFTSNPEGSTGCRKGFVNPYTEAYPRCCFHVCFLGNINQDARKKETDRKRKSKLYFRKSLDSVLDHLQRTRHKQFPVIILCQRHLTDGKQSQANH